LARRRCQRLHLRSQREPNFLDDFFDLVEDFVVRESDDRHIGLRLDRLGSPAVVRLLPIVVSAVHFDNETRSRTVKIDDESQDNRLPAEFETRDSPAPESSPKKSFRMRGVVAQLSREGELLSRTARSKRYGHGMTHLPLWGGERIIFGMSSLVILTEKNRNRTMGVRVCEFLVSRPPWTFGRSSDFRQRGGHFHFQGRV
jgi:hypothetical protein